MKNILELLCDPPSIIHEPDSPFVRMARIKNETMEILNGSLTDKQKKLLEAYFDADTKIEEIMSLSRFRYAFHFGVQLMAEMIEGKEELLK